MKLQIEENEERVIQERIKIERVFGQEEIIEGEWESDEEEGEEEEDEEDDEEDDEDHEDEGFMDEIDDDGELEDFQDEIFSKKMITRKKRVIRR